VRCFVALLPDAAARARLAAAAAALAPMLPGARRVAPHNLHLTLAFLGELAAGRAAAVAAALAQLPPAQGVWRIDRLDGYARARVAWAGGAPDARLDALAGAVRALLERLGVPYDPQPFAAHVTLLRGARGLAPRPLAPAADWLLGPAALMVSARDAQGSLRYRPWPADAAGL
jgi:2'-5' RNA ligase